MKGPRAAILAFVLGCVALLAAIALLPGRSRYTPLELSDYWLRFIWRLFSYQQLVAGILALLAGTAVVFAAIIQRDAQRHQAERERLRAQIGVASALRAEVRALVTACDEFEAKFLANVSRFRITHDRTKTGTIPLPLTSRIYEAIMPDLQKLPADIATAVVHLYAAYDVYRINLMQAFDFGSADIDTQFEELKKNITGELRRRCETTDQKLRAFIEDVEAHD